MNEVDTEVDVQNNEEFRRVIVEAFLLSPDERDTFILGK